MKAIADNVIYRGNSILDVSHFINEQVDMNIINLIIEDIYNKVSMPIDRIVTIESGGIIFAGLLANKLNCKLSIIKKRPTKDENKYAHEVKSYTKNTSYFATLNKNYICENENILFVDDFLATGSAVLSVQDICEDANAKLVMCAFVIEKSFENGRNSILPTVTVHSCAVADDIINDKIIWRDDEL